MKQHAGRVDLDALRSTVADIEDAPTFEFGQPVGPMVNKDGVILEHEIQPLPDHHPLTTADLAPIIEDEEDPSREPFGAWLLKQRDRKGWVADLAKAAESDPQFPRTGDPDTVRKHLQMRGADGDAFEALDDAELDRASL